MWSLETIVQINQAHAETGDARKAYEKCGIRVCGDCPVRGKCKAGPLPPVEIVRCWDEAQGWMHQARQGDTVLTESRCRATVIEQYPDAIRAGRVICGPNEYTCEDEAA